MAAAAYLTNRAAEVRAKLDRFGKTTALAGQAERVQTRADQLAEVLDRLRTCSSVLKSFHSRDIHPPNDAGTATVLRVRLTDLREEWEADPSRIAASDRNVRYDLWARLEQFPNRVDQVIAASWEEFVRSLTPAQPREVLEVLVEVPGLRTQALEMRSLAQQLSERAVALPRGESDFTETEALANQIRELWSDLEGAGIPQAVLSFLSLATRDGATFEHYTTEVSDWLEERSLTRLLRVRFATDV